MRSPLARAFVTLSIPVAVVSSSTAAAAQERNAVAVGGGFTFRAASARDVHGDSGVGIRWRFGHSDTGWGWNYGLGWYSADLDRTIAGRSVGFGELKVRPIVGGYGYTHAVTPRTFVSASLVGGFAFSAFEMSDAGDAALREIGRPATQIETSFLTPVLKPEVGMWYDVGHKFGLGMNVGYTIARPRLTLSIPSGPGGRESYRVNADCLSIGVGVVYKIF